MLKIRSLENKDDKTWDDFVSSTPTCTFFHTLGWKRVIEQIFPYRSEYLLAEEDGQIQGILPLFEVKSFLGTRSWLSVPFGVYGGVSAKTAEAERSLLESVKTLAQERRIQCVEFRHERPCLEPWPSKDLYYTFRRELFGTVEENFQSIPRKQRRMIRQGEKHGLAMTLNGLEALDDFYAIYTHSLRKLGTPAFPRAYFSELLTEFGHACRIVGVWKDQRMVGAVMTFFFKDQVLPYYGGALSETVKYAVYDFMYWAVMQHAVEAGYRIFDFGRSKKGTGAFDFKRHWGFEPALLPYQFYLPQGGAIPNLNPSNPKLKWALEIWKRMPIGMTRVLGPHLIRYVP